MYVSIKVQGRAAESCGSKKAIICIVKAPRVQGVDK
jgi:hypothetical protein